MLLDPTVHQTYRNELQKALRAENPYSKRSGKAPALNFRTLERIVCKALGAKDIAGRSETYDVISGITGIGVKTFLLGEKALKKMEKVAEINKEKGLTGLTGLDLATKVAEVRNKRISDMDKYGTKKAIYHCVARRKNELVIAELSYEPLNVANIEVVKDTPGTSLLFTDGKSNYRYNYSKNTLYMEFDLSKSETRVIELAPIMAPKFIIIPLYRENKSGNKEVPAKSGINMWNAGGRARHRHEVYVRFPAEIRNMFPRFFPAPEVSFKLRLHTQGNKVVKAKVCQQGNKAIMSDPNKALGEWIYHALRYDGDTPITYEYLHERGQDCVRFTKVGDNEYSIALNACGAYEEFLESIQDD